MTLSEGRGPIQGRFLGNVEGRSKPTGVLVGDMRSLGYELHSVMARSLPLLALEPDTALPEDLLPE